MCVCACVCVCVCVCVRLGQVARGKLAFVTLPDGKKDGQGLLAVTANPSSLASLFQVSAGM